MHEVTKRKGADYTGGGDPFANFKQIEYLPAGITAEQGFVTRMSDKLSRIASLINPASKGPQVKDEALQDTLLDLANYCLLLYGYLELSGADRPSAPPSLAEMDKARAEYSAIT